MAKKRAAIILKVLLCLLVMKGAEVSNAFAQRDTRESVTDDGQRRFFEQLRSLFGRFREADLDRAFAAARPIQCSELVSGDGIWRPVAFFNEDRRLGDWYHGTLDEVKAELSEYTFKGVCRGDQTGVQLSTKFPIVDSLERYYNGRTHLNEVRMNSNPAVAAYFEPRTQIYTFDLPYLYAEQRRGDVVYSLLAQHPEDRIDPSVTNHWECKSVHADDVTFEFMICQTWTLPRDAAARRASRPSFGSSAYFILSDGREASTSVKLVFGGGGGDEKDGPPTELRTVDVPAHNGDVKAPATDGPPVSAWELPSPGSRLLSLSGQEFRIRFNPQTWANVVATSQVLSDKKIAPLRSSNPAAGTDYCVWQPGSASLVSRVLSQEPDPEVDYVISTSDGGRLSSPSITFEMKTFTGARLGSLQCFFPRAEAPDSVQLERWETVVGEHLKIETRR